MKNRKLILILSLVLALTMSLGGTLAYLTDTDGKVNVMTVGRVDIEQHEYERAVDENGEFIIVDTSDVNPNYGYNQAYKLQEFTQGKPALPVVYNKDGQYEDSKQAWDTFQQLWNQVGAEGSNDLFHKDMKNVIDKFVFVENTGNTDAYYRTLIAIENPEGLAKGMIHTSFNHNTRFIPVTGTNSNVADGSGDATYFVDYIIIDGVRYALYNVTYKEILTPEEVSRPSLLQVFLDQKADNEDVALFGNTWEILVVSQAVQATGFASAQEALNEAFGVVSATSHPWSDQEPAIQIVSAKTSQELADAIANNDEAVINLTAGEYTTNLKVAGGKDITIIGTKDTVLSGQIATTSSEEGTLTLRGVTVKVDDTIVDSTGISQTGKSAIAIWGNQTVICENVTFEMSKAESTAITSWWDTGIGTSIIVKNCTFNCNGQRPIRATGNVTVENCTFNDPYRYAVQLTAKADTATLLDKAIINFNNNTIVNGKSGKAFVYGIQLEGADYGCNDLVINGAGNTIVDDGTDSHMYYCECGKVDHDTIKWNVETPAVHVVPQP